MTDEEREALERDEVCTCTPLRCHEERCAQCVGRPDTLPCPAGWTL